MRELFKSAKFTAVYSETFGQVRIYSRLIDNFYFWLTPLSRVDTVDGIDSTREVRGPFVERHGERVRVRFEFVSSLWQHKECIYEISERGIEYSIRIQGTGRLGRVYFNTGLLKNAVVGSMPGFDHYTPGCPNFLGKEKFFANEFFSISVTNDTASWGLALNSGPFIYSFFKDGAPHSLWAGLIVKPKENSFDGFDFNFAAPENAAVGDGILNTQSFSVDYSGHCSIEGAWESPHLYFAFAKNRTESLRDYCGLLEERGAIAGKQEKNASWWLKPIFCGWHEQCALALMEKTKTGMSFAEVEGGADMAGQCTQANYEHFLDVIKRRNLPIGALIIDAKWQKTFGAFDEDRAKWPDMRGFIDSCHASGIKVILWLRAWGKTEGLDEDECLKVNGRAASLDPTSPKYIERVRKGMRYMLSGAAGCLDGDGLKLDATNVIPIGRDITTYADLYGFELQRAYFELMYTSATAVKADACVSLFSANPYFRDVCNSVRLGDHYSVYGRAVDTMRQRAAVARIAMAGKPIDTDGTMRFSLEEEILPELREQAREGIPCLYQIEYLLQMRGFGEPRIRKFSEAEYAGIKNILDDYIAALQ